MFVDANFIHRFEFEAAQKAACGAYFPPAAHRQQP